MKCFCLLVIIISNLFAFSSFPKTIISLNYFRFDWLPFPNSNDIDLFLIFKQFKEYVAKKPILKSLLNVITKKYCKMIFLISYHC